MTSLRTVVAELQAHRVPGLGSEVEVIQRAWASSDEPELMLRLLTLAANLGLLGFGGYQRRGSQLFLIVTPGTEGPRRISLDGHGVEAAQQLRAAIPEVPPAQAWMEAIEAQRATIADPIALLLWDTERFGSPDDGWHARWTIEAAWRECRSAFLLRVLLERMGDQSGLARIRAAKLPPSPVFVEFDEQRNDEAERAFNEGLLAAFREAVPDPPPLPAAWAFTGMPGLFGPLLDQHVLTRAEIAPLIACLPAERFVRTAARGGEAFDSTRWPLSHDLALATVPAARRMFDASHEALLSEVRRAARQGLYAYHVHRRYPGDGAMPAATLIRAALDQGVMTRPELLFLARVLVAFDGVRVGLGAKSIALRGSKLTLGEAPPGSAEIPAGPRLRLMLEFDTTPGWLEHVGAVRALGVGCVPDAETRLPFVDSALPPQLQAPCAVASLASFVEAALETHLSANPHDEVWYAVLDATNRASELEGRTNTPADAFLVSEWLPEPAIVRGIAERGSVRVGDVFDRVVRASDGVEARVSPLSVVRIVAYRREIDAVPRGLSAELHCVRSGDVTLADGDILVVAR